jgi:hypothetical protein
VLIVANPGLPGRFVTTRTPSPPDATNQPGLPRFGASCTARPRVSASFAATGVTAEGVAGRGGRGRAPRRPSSLTLAALHHTAACAPSCQRVGRSSAPTSPAQSAGGGGWQPAPTRPEQQKNDSRTPPPPRRWLIRRRRPRPGDRPHVAPGTCRRAEDSWAWLLRDSLRSAAGVLRLPVRAPVVPVRMSAWGGDREPAPGSH